jgi:hypothetical protein
MIGGSIGSFVLLGVLSTFLFLGRSGANISNYHEMEQHALRGLEYFAQDTRQASELNWNHAASVSILVKGATITYAFDSSTRTFSRTLGGTTSVLLSGITDFTFSGYMITDGAVDLSDLSTAAKRASASAITKQIQISLRASRTSATVATATNTVLSARFILRNKRVTT